MNTSGWLGLLGGLGLLILLTAIEQGHWGFPIMFAGGMVAWFLYGWWVKRHP
jgi:hypothetical protein